ncbi:hypothetical protein MKW98_011639 [Papaver atlanticum]|uniref:F-box domain-containing protein n=1 Tax=Papaver atlanticum TaxID=357466 RepID=A0AAD4S9U1_9MAGN|nr:hypothetical protein MKW98_011639 [Papaver atlanticum]
MGRLKKVSKKRKRSSDADNEKEAISKTATCPTLVVDDGVVCDILSRLPAKSLMRFKCVSKHWCSLIKDPYFVDLHFRTPKTVLTLGTNSWRRIEDVPSLPDGLTPSSIYVNGSIYWFPEKFQKGNWNHGVTVCIMAFDVGSEKFRKIQIPQFIVDQPIDFYPPFQACVRLQEVKCCSAILRRVKDSAVKLWVHGINNNGTGDESWNEQIITLPGCLYKSVFPAVFFFHSITGTDQLIIEIHQTESSGNKKCTSLFSYSWQDKTFKKMKISRIPSSATVRTSFIESLVSFPQAEMKPHIQPSTAFDNLQHPIQKKWPLLTFLQNAFRLSR